MAANEMHAYIPEYEEPLTLFVENVLHYIAGNVARTVAKRLKCAECAGVLFDRTHHTSAKKLTDIRDFGGLSYVSGDILKLFKVSEKSLRCHLSNRSTAERNLMANFILKTTTI